MAFDWMGFIGMVLTLRIGFTIGVVVNAITWVLVPFGEYPIKGLHFGVFALILIGRLGIPMMFIPFAPVTGLILLVAFVAMYLYALYYVFDFLF